MPRAFLVKKTRGASLYKSEPVYNEENLETKESKSTNHTDPRQYRQDTQDSRENESDITEQKFNIWEKYHSTSHDETSAFASSNLPQYPQRSNVIEFAQPVDLSHAKPILLPSSNSAFEYVGPSSMHASPASQPNKQVFKTHTRVDQPLYLQVPPTTDRYLTQSSVTEAGSVSAHPASLYNAYASYQRRQLHGPNPAAALYSYMIEETALTRASPFGDASSYQYSDWNYGGSDRYIAAFSNEVHMTIPPCPNQNPDVQGYCNTSASCYLDKHILSTDRNNDNNVGEIQKEQQLALNPSPSKGDHLKMSPQLPNPDRLALNHMNPSQDFRNQGQKRSVRQPILGLEYIQNTPNPRDSKSPDGGSSQLPISQDQGAERCVQLDNESNCSSEQQKTPYTSAENTPVSSGKALLSNADRPSQYKKHICDVCGKGFSRSNTLVTHKRIHTGDKPFKCELCGRAFRQPGNLTRHRLTHTTVKPYVCQQCDKAFNRASNLHTHTRTHTNYKPFICQYCGKGFHQKIDMKIHSYTHTGEKPHKCMECGRGFKQLTHLTYHMRTHSDIKMYTCTYCGKGFNQKGNLQAHIYGHTGERPYHCEICSKGFTLASTLNTHRRTHADKKPCACQHCDKDFYQNNALKSHMTASHPYTNKSLL